MTPEQRSALTAADAAVVALVEAHRVLRASLAAAEPPAPSPAPTPAGKYRYDQPTLWTRVDVPAVPSRLPGGQPLPLDRVGPTHTVVCARVDWPWRKPGGDWIDADGVLHGARPWASVVCNKGRSQHEAADYAVDVTDVVRRVLADDRWCALMLRCPGYARVMAGQRSEMAPVLRLHGPAGVVDVDVHVAAAISPSSAYPSTAVDAVQLPAVVEFGRAWWPEQIDRAELLLTITQHWSGTGGPPVLQVYLVDPLVNSDPVQIGIAAAQPLDAGLHGHPAIIGVHRITDSTTLADIAEVRDLPSHLRNYNALPAYDPALYGLGNEDQALLPHRSLGKWIGVDAKRWSVVPSSYAAEGFEALAPGVGAVRVTYPSEVAGDDVVVGYATSDHASAKIFMPPEHFGRLDEIFVRYYLRLGTPDGGPYIFDPSTRYQVRTQAGALPRWTDCAGKIGIMPAHDTTYGGVSGTSGGGEGWQMRMAWSDVDLPAGPDVGGIGMALHWHDFQSNNPPGYRYGSPGVLGAGESSLAQRGALGGMVYAHRWYCIETRLKLNSVNQPAVLADGAPHLVNGVRQFWTPDGEMDVWIDGRLAYHKDHLVIRSLPLGGRQNQRPAGYLPPVGNLGVRDLWFNWFHGGLTKSSRDRVLFLTGVAWGTEYIGPMRNGE